MGAYSHGGITYQTVMYEIILNLCSLNFLSIL
jgi:hypothetical protein